MTDDQSGMERKCARMVELMSAELDGETTAAQSREVHEHLATCAACAGWLRDAREATRQAVVSRTPTPPDVSGAVLAHLTQDRPPYPLRAAVARTLLVSMGLVQLFHAGLSLVADGGHLGRDMSTFDMALALAVLAVALRPWRAAGLFPLLAILSGLLVLTVGSDLVRGLTSPSQELPHLLVVLEFLVIWQLRNNPGPVGSLPPAPSGIDAPPVARVA